MDEQYESASSGNAYTSSSEEENNHVQSGPVYASAAEAKALGNEKYKAGKYFEAIDMYTRAIEMEPEEPMYLNNRAAAYVMVNRFSNGLNDAKRAIALDATNPKYSLRAAKCALSLGRRSDAERYYGEVLQLDAQNATALRELQQLKQISNLSRSAMDAMSSGQYNNAISLMDRALALAPSDTKLVLLKAEAYLGLGKMGETDRITAAILRENGNNTDALCVRGMALFKLGDLEKAQKHFTLALRGDPDHKRARSELKTVKKITQAKEAGNEAFKGRRYKEAVDLYTEALNMNIECPPFVAKLHYNRALCTSRLGGDTESAIADCTAALDADPSYTKALLKRAALRLDAEEFEAAVRDFEEAAEQEPSNRDIRQQLRNAKIELKKSKRKNYYKILGVAKTATSSEIKKAYRKLAMTCHPDRVQGDEAKEKAEAKFKEIGKPYAILSDPEKRQQFDNGHDMEEGDGGGGGGPGGFAGGIDPAMFAQMFGGGGGFSFGGGGRGGGGGGFPGGMGGFGGGGGGFPF